MSDQPPSWTYSNLSDRPLGPYVSLAARLLPGVRTVQDQMVPYAQAWQRHNRAAAGRPGPLWVALGDSLTQGIGASGYDRGWVGQLSRRLREAGHEHRVINLAISGARVADVLDRQLPQLQRLTDTGNAPALVTLLIGSNDLFRPRYRRELPAGFEVLLQRLPAGTVVANLPNPNATAQTLNRALHRAVAERALVLADLRQPRTTSWRGKLAADHFHPNDRGYAGIADAFADALGQRSESKMSPETGDPGGRPGSANHSRPNASR